MARVHLIALRLLRRPDGIEPGLPALPIGATGAVIGRAPDCDLVLEDPLRLVSRQHAQLLPQGANTAMLRCISAAVSIAVNGDPLLPGGELLVKVGDRLRIGGFELQIEATEPAPTPAPLASPVAPPVAAPVAAPLAPPVMPPPAAAAVTPAMPVDASPVGKAPAANPFVDSARSRLDQWFDLDTVADPLSPGSPLPTADEVSPAPATRQAAAVPAAAFMPPPLPVSVPWQPQTDRVRPQDPARPALAVTRVDAPAQGFDDDLMRAFLHGAGLAAGGPMSSAALNAAWMRHLGALLRAATEGTLALLRSRAVTKRSIRAEGTRIAPRENNPLKFAPDAAEALALLVGKQSAQGFLDPVDAVRDAHNDLLVHQLAMVAGMRAAVFELISRLGPEAIESQQGPATGLARHLPLLREATLWRRHRQQHAHLIANLDDDFEAVFGREFLVAYEAQSRLAAAHRPAPGERA